MEQVEKIILAVLKPGSYIGIIITVFFFVIRNQPITLLTATRVEKISYSKEKKASLKALEYFFFVFTVSLLSFCILLYSYELRVAQYVFVLLIQVGVLVGGIIFFIWKTITYKEFTRYQRSNSDRKNLLFAFLSLLYCTNAIILPSFYFGSSIDETFLNLDGQNPFLISELIAAYIVCIIISVFVTFFIKSVIGTFLRVDFNTDNSLYFLKQEGSIVEQWFIFHLTDREHILVGNKPYLDESTEFRFMDRSEMFSNKIYLYRRP